jgi:protein CWC15
MVFRSSDSDDDDDDDDDDEDETAELMRELEKIKKERQEEAARIEAQKKLLEDRESQDAVLGANPLLRAGAGGDSVVKRRWDDDVVFKNQARDEPQVKKRFINDTIRNDFHRKFLTKFIQ